MYSFVIEQRDSNYVLQLHTRIRGYYKATHMVNMAIAQ